jgi:hypothetical protein
MLLVQNKKKLRSMFYTWLLLLLFLTPLSLLGAFAVLGYFFEKFEFVAKNRKTLGIFLMSVIFSLWTFLWYHFALKLYASDCVEIPTSTQVVHWSYSPINYSMF